LAEAAKGLTRDIEFVEKLDKPQYGRTVAYFSVYKSDSGAFERHLESMGDAVIAWGWKC
jgi:hypothetical protein